MFCIEVRSGSKQVLYIYLQNQSYLMPSWRHASEVMTSKDSHTQAASTQCFVLVCDRRIRLSPVWSRTCRCSCSRALPEARRARGQAGRRHAWLKMSKNDKNRWVRISNAKRWVLCVMRVRPPHSAIECFSEFSPTAVNICGIQFFGWKFFKWKSNCIRTVYVCS